MIPVLDDAGFLAGVGIGILILVYIGARRLGLGQEEAFALTAFVLAIGGVIIMLSVGGAI